MRTFKKTTFFLSVMTALLLVVAGCSSNDDGGNTEEGNNEGQEEQQNNEEQPQEEQDQTPSAELDSDADLKEQLQAEEEVDEAMVQIVKADDKQTINVDIQISSGQEWNEEWLTKYKEMIREKYPDQQVDLIIAQDGSPITQETLK